MEEEIEKCWNNLLPDIKQVLLKEGKLQKAPLSSIKLKVYVYKAKLLVNLPDSTLKLLVNLPDSTLFNFCQTSSVFGNSSYQRIDFWHRVLYLEDYELFYKKINSIQTITIGEEKFII